MRGSDIKRYLEENGIKQNYLSEKTGIPANVLNAIMNDKRKIEVNEYLKICDVLELPLDYFRPRSEDDRKSRPREAGVLQEA